MKRSEELAAHLEYFSELGVAGVSRDPAWRDRPAEMAARASETGAASAPPVAEPAAASETGPAPATPAASELAPIAAPQATSFLDEPVFVPEGATAGDLLGRLRSIYPSLPSSNSVLIAVNSEYVAATDPLHEGDEVAFIPPVSGGQT